MYWSVTSLVYLFETWTYYILRYLPFYSWFRVAFLAYLVLPQTQGARALYVTYVGPFIHDHEHQFEAAIIKTVESGKAAGLLYLQQLIDYVRMQLGFQSLDKMHPQQQQQTSQTTSTYTQGLLSRFYMPNFPGIGVASPTETAANGPGDLMGYIGSTVSALTGRTEGVDADSSSIYPAQMTSASLEEKLEYIRAEETKLQRLTQALNHQKNVLHEAHQKKHPSRPKWW